MALDDLSLGQPATGTQAGGLAIPAGTFIFTFIVGTLKEVWATGHWVNLLSGKIFFSLGLFIFSLFIPIVIRKLKIWQSFESP